MRYTNNATKLRLESGSTFTIKNHLPLLHFFIKIILFSSIFVYILSISFSTDMKISIEESSQITKLPSQQFSINAEGVLSIYNPTSSDTVYEFSIPFELDSLVGISSSDVVEFVNVNHTITLFNYTNCSTCFSPSNLSLLNVSCDFCLTNSTNTSLYSNCNLCHDQTNYSLVYSDIFKCPVCDLAIPYNKTVTEETAVNLSKKFKFKTDKISGFMIEPNETIKVGYKIFGLMDYNIYDQISPNESLFDYYVDSYNFNSKINFNLQKAQREGFIYSPNGSVNSSPSGNSSRLVSAGVDNPTDFNYFVNDIKVYKTEAGNETSFFDYGSILGAKENISIAPHQKLSLDFFDYDSSQNSVYWLTPVFFINYDLQNIVSHNFVDESTNINDDGSEVSSGSSGGSSGGYASSHDNYHGNNPANPFILVKKEANQTVLYQDERLLVTVKIINPNEFVLHNLTFEDTIPQGYELIEGKGFTVENNKLYLKINNISEYETLVLNYVVTIKNDFKGISYLKPAKVRIKQKEYFSQGVLVINNMLPYKKLLVQKRINYIDEKFAEVFITVKNLGNYDLKDLLIADSIDNVSIIKDISKVFYKDKSSWFIKELKAGDTWEVSYITNRDNTELESIPNVFGFSKKDVLGTIISSEEIVTSYNNAPGKFEKVGLAVAIVIVILYIVF